MNKINHKPAQDIIANIIVRIKKQVETALKYKEQKVNYEMDNRLADEFRNTKIAEINAKYLQEIKETRAFIAEQLEKVGEIEKETESILDFDVPEFSETMAAINATKGELPDAVIFGIRDKFKGNYQVMATIKAALEGFGVDLKSYKFNDYAKPAEETIKRLIINAENIETSADSSFISLRDLLKDIVYFGRCRGMVFSDEFVTLDPKMDDAISDYLVREVMGVEPVKEPRTFA